MRVVVVPNALSDAIYAAIDKQLVDHPGAKPDRENYYDQLLAYYDEHGIIPDFKIERPPSEGE